MFFPAPFSSGRVERLWRTVNYEEVYLKAYADAGEARRELGAYFRFYNDQRPHQALGYRTPAEVYHQAMNVPGKASEERRCSPEPTRVSLAGAAGLSLNSTSILSNLPGPPQTGLVPVSSTGQALWVCGAILAGSACQNAVAAALSTKGNWYNLRQRLREWLYDGGDRTSPCQTELDVSLCFAPLLWWVLAWWRSGRLALPVDPTSKKDDTLAIVISAAYRGCAIPVAWRIHRATQRGSWMDLTVELLKELAPAVPHDMTVIVLCDRGISSPKLRHQMRAQGWHPCMRYRKSITFCADGGSRLPALRFVSRPDTAWIGQGAAFGTPTAQRRCTLLVVWYDQQQEPWVILTDLPPQEVSVTWYALRFWIELGFKAVKSLGWKWDKTRRTDPARISRHWLALSVATLLALAYGTRACPVLDTGVEDAQDRRIAPGSLRAPPKALAPNHWDPRSRPARTVSVIRDGIDWLKRLLLKGSLWSRVWLLPEPWPQPKKHLEVTHHAPS